MSGSFDVRVPSVESTAAFAALLRRHAAAARVAHRYAVAVDLYFNEGGPPPPETARGCHPYGVVTHLACDVWECVSHTDFLTPYGWPEGVAELLDVLRTPRSAYHPNDFREAGSKRYDVAAAAGRVGEIEARSAAFAGLVTPEPAQGPIRPPIVWTPPEGPPRWPGGEPRFPIDPSFYLAALRGELAKLIDEAKAYRGLRDATGKPLPAAAAGGIHALAFGVGRYCDGLARAVAEPGGETFPEARDALPALGMVATRVHDALAAGSMVGVAEAVSAPEALAILQWARGRLPDVQFDFSVPSPEPAAASPADAGEPEAAPMTLEPEPAKVKRPKQSQSLGKIDDRATARYMENPSLTFKQLAGMLNCDPSTLRNAKRCPKLAAAREAVERGRLDYAKADEWHDRDDD